MRSVLLSLAVLLCTAAARADLGSGGHPADGFVTNGVAYARRGALGGDSYVVTNLWTDPPSYALVVTGGAAVVDRAVNRRVVSGRTVFAVPPVPVKRTYDAWRPARSFVIVTEIADDPPPEVSFSGFSRIYTIHGDLTVGKGVTWISFLEIGDGEFVVETTPISQLE